MKFGDYVSSLFKLTNKIAGDVCIAKVDREVSRRI